MSKLSIIIPVFNEENTIREILKKVLAVKLPKGIQKEIIIIDDGSTDKTAQVLSEFKIKNLEFKILSHKKNRGKGAAIKSGLSLATGDYIIVQDADLEYEPSYYVDLLRPALTRQAPVVYGTRLLNYPLRFWGQGKTVLPTHLIANKLLTLLTNMLYGSCMTDMETGYKLFSMDILRNLDLRANRFDFEAEVTAKILKRKIPIIEVPISVTPRTYGEGKKIGWPDGLSAIWTLLKYKFSD